MDNSPIEKLFLDCKAILNFLETSNQLSLRNDVHNIVNRYLVLATGSYFEERIINILLDFVSKASRGNKLVFEFLKNKSFKRQYHTFFEWESTNANSFFGLFGKDFLDYMRLEVEKNERLKLAIKNFIQMGALRNSLAHTNVGSVILEKTADETYAQYLSAEEFIVFFQRKLLERT